MSGSGGLRAPATAPAGSYSGEAEIASIASEPS